MSQATATGSIAVLATGLGVVTVTAVECHLFQLLEHQRGGRPLAFSEDSKKAESKAELAIN